MIDRLRRKIIIINVISVCVVFLIAIAVIFGTGYIRIAKERSTRLSSMLAYDDLLDHINLDEQDSERYKGVAFIEYDVEKDEIVHQSYSKEFKLPVSQMSELIDGILQQSNTDGTINGRVQYSKQTVDNTTRIVLYDRYASSSNLLIYVWYTLSAVLIGVLCYFVISLILAQIALKPVENNWVRQKQFVADASHELKTPLSVIMANTEIIASHAEETVASQMKWIENTRSESQRMAELVNDLLFLAKNDDGLKAQMEVVNLSDCIETSVLSQESLLYENGKQFSYKISPQVYIWGNMGQLKQLATILIDNANKYSLGDGNIRLEMSVVGKQAHLTVSNDCAELTAEQLEHLFDRFYTVDQSRNKSVTGNGLGLSIAQIICKTHSGRITAAYAGGRITFTAIFPLSKK